MPPDISLLSTKPSARDWVRHRRVDLYLPLPNGGRESVAYNVLQTYADAIITAINERDQLLDLLANLVDDAPNALAAARSYLNHRLSESPSAPDR